MNGKRKRVRVDTEQMFIEFEEKLKTLEELVSGK